MCLIYLWDGDSGPVDVLKKVHSILFLQHKTCMFKLTRRVTLRLLYQFLYSRHVTFFNTRWEFNPPIHFSQSTPQQTHLHSQSVQTSSSDIQLKTRKCRWQITGDEMAVILSYQQSRPHLQTRTQQYFSLVHVFYIWLEKSKRSILSSDLRWLYVNCLQFPLSCLIETVYCKLGIRLSANNLSTLSHTK